MLVMNKTTLSKKTYIDSFYVRVLIDLMACDSKVCDFSYNRKWKKCLSLWLKQCELLIVIRTLKWATRSYSILRGNVSVGDGCGFFLKRIVRICLFAHEARNVLCCWIMIYLIKQFSYAYPFTFYVQVFFNCWFHFIFLNLK